MEVVCGPCVLIVVHRRRKDHGKDLEFSQPMLEAKGDGVEGWRRGEKKHKEVKIKKVEENIRWIT